MDKSTPVTGRPRKMTLMLAGDHLQGWQHVVDKRLEPGSWIGVTGQHSWQGLDRRKVKVVRVGDWYSTQPGWRLAAELNRWKHGKA
jgi:hypothetical protein